MDHPAVHQCVTFAMPHDMLGEEVAAAVVLRQGAPGHGQGACASSPSARLAPVQGAAEDLDSRRDSGGRDGQAAAHRTRTETGTRVGACAIADGGTRVRVERSASGNYDRTAARDGAVRLRPDPRGPARSGSGCLLRVARVLKKRHGSSAPKTKHSADLALRARHPSLGDVPPVLAAGHRTRGLPN